MKYPFRVFQTRVEEHSFWIAECPTLKGCVGQGDTIEEAIHELEENELQWLELAQEYGLQIPEIPVDPINKYSGKFSLRIAPHVHQEAAEIAKRQGISLNQYFNDAIVAQNARISAIDYIAPEVETAVQRFKGLFSISAQHDAETTSTILSDSYAVNGRYGAFRKSAPQVYSLCTYHQ